jgi:mRNA interferase RelE/StbE
MPYAVLLTPEARADLVQLDASVRSRLLDKLDWMGINADLLRHEALQGEKWRDCYRYRVGDYRIIYRLQQSQSRVVVLRVVHRREAYR